MFEKYNKLKGSEEFKKYNKKHPSSYLTSIFFMISNNQIEQNKIQFNFYNPKDKKISSFSVSETTKAEYDDKVLSDGILSNGKDLPKLVLADVKIGINQIKKFISKIFSERYHYEVTTKIILILQRNDAIPYWNITCLTSSLNVLNLKVNAVNEEILSEKFEPILNFRQK